MLKKLFDNWPWVSKNVYNMELARLRYETEMQGKAIKEITKERDRLRRGIIPQPKDPQLEAVFTDKKGTVYYRYKEPTEMPFTRIFAAQQLLTLQSAMLNPERYKEAVEAIKTEFDKGEVAEGYWMHRNLIDLMSIPAAADLCLELAAILYLREGENPQSMDEGTKAEKIAAWKEDRDTLNFFLLRSAKEHWDFSKHTDESILESLKQNQRHAEKLLENLQTG